MSRTLTVAGLLIDSWRDYPQTQPGERNLPGDAVPVGHFGSTSDGEPSAPRLTSLIELGAVKWDSR